MKKRRKHICLACGKLYAPDPRSEYRQKYCSDEACRKASHQASQARWLNKEANRNYHRGPAAVARVRAWRAAHPKYWKRSRALQDDCLSQEVAADNDKSCLTPEADALQDHYATQQAVLVGLVAMITGTLQEDMALTLGNLQIRGQALLGNSSLAAAVKGVCKDDGS
jgi:hypothetical protein